MACPILESAGNKIELLASFSWILLILFESSLSPNHRNTCARMLRKGYQCKSHIYLLSLARILRTKAILHVDCGRSALEDTKGRDDRRGHAVLGLVDLEVAQRSLRLGSPVLVRGHLDLAKGVALDSLVGHVGSRGVDSSVAGGNSRRGGLQK